MCTYGSTITRSQTLSSVQSELAALEGVKANIAARVHDGKLLSLDRHLDRRIAQTQARLTQLKAAQPEKQSPADDLIDTIVEPVSQPLVTPQPPAYSRAAAIKRYRKQLLMALLLGSAGTATAVGGVKGARGTAAEWKNRSRSRYINPTPLKVRICCTRYGTIAHWRSY